MTYYKINQYKRITTIRCNKDETNKTKNSNKKLSNKISSSYKSIFNYNQTELGSVKEKNTLETLKEFYKVRNEFIIEFVLYYK